MASYHLSVKTVQRSAGRSATAAVAYRAAERIACEREGRVHDYRAKQGVEASFIVAPEDAPTWVHDRQALWNAAEARETRSNSVTAREWELALPHELDAGGRRLLVESFARELVSRYGVAADVAIHAPHREGDQRNWHAHVLTTTRALTREGLADKTRALDAKQTGGAEIAHMRERWAEMQNRALERARVAERVDHRSLAVQRDEARSLGHEAQADNLDRAPEVKLGSVVSAIERREQRAAEREEREYVPLTERGAQVHEARATRSLFAELARVRDALREKVRQRAEAARETYQHVREEGANRVRAGLAALRAAAERQGRGHGLAQDAGPGREAAHYAQEGPQHGLGAGLPAHDREQPGPERSLGAEAIYERLEALRERARPGVEQERGEPALERGIDKAREELARLRAQDGSRAAQSHETIRERLRGVLDRAKPVAAEREELGQEHAQERQAHREHEAEREEHCLKPRDHGISYGL
ncbi:MobQ family relaxase [Rubellimicrobium rubrum]|uniref:MobQ family relaxase n=1 Tax=Rubellimicrobium rubrum TaxID=2585369 RepID=UPI002482D8EC|nr:MobQ family relaxase [Rubellimicrobium rubrum]